LDYRQFRWLAAKPNASLNGLPAAKSLSLGGFLLLGYFFGQ